jgi:hypothetical protein
VRGDKGGSYYYSSLNPTPFEEQLPTCCKLQLVASLNLLQVRTGSNGQTTGRREPPKPAFPHNGPRFPLTLLLVTYKLGGMETRVCQSTDCRKEFEPINDRQHFCSHGCGSRERVRRMRAKHRKNGGGNGGGGGGGLFVDPITPVDSRAVYVPDIRYRTPEVTERKPSSTVTRYTEKSHKTAA